MKLTAENTRNNLYNELEILEAQLLKLGGDFDNNGNRCDGGGQSIIDRMKELETLVSETWSN